jgi:hypothetical protein
VGTLQCAGVDADARWREDEVFVTWRNARMPKTIPTTIGPNPTDRRVLQLEQLLNVSRPHAVGVVVMSWAWLHAEQAEGVVPGLPSMLDSVVDIAGAGQALVDAGLVGVSPDGLVLPLELRRQAERATRSGESADDRRRRKDAERKAKSRRNQRLTKPASKTRSPSPTAENTGPRRTPTRLGDVEGFSVMLLWGSYGPFYKLAGAEPKAWTGTVTDPERPSYADALVALHAAMKLEAGKGLGSGDNFRPSLQAVVDAAERYREQRASAAADAARRDEGNRALAEASADDQEDIDHEPAERDLSHPCPHVTADTVTCPHGCPQSGHSPVAASPNGRQELDAESCPHECPQSGHNPAPSSSSSSVFPGNESSKNTTTTSVVTTRKRDHEDDILDRFVPRKDPVVGERERKRQEVAERFAAALGVTVESIIQQWRHRPDILRARLEEAGINPNTGLAVNAEASHEPREARDDTGMTTEPIDHDKPAAGSVDTRDDVEFDCAADDIRRGLQQAGLVSPVKPAPLADNCAFVSAANC